MVSEDELKGLILFKLNRKGKWGHSHIPFDKITRFVPSHLRGTVKEITQQLIKDGLIISKPTFYGLEISLNNSRKSEIDGLIKKFGPRL